MIYYWVPEDKDDAEECNAFGIEKRINEVTIKDIREAFPVPGRYHFRFKFLMNKEVVWMDMVNDECVALLFQNRVVVKATRISWEPDKEAKKEQAAPRVEVKVVQPTMFNVFDSPPKKSQEGNTFNFLLDN